MPVETLEAPPTINSESQIAETKMSETLQLHSPIATTERLQASETHSWRRRIETIRMRSRDNLETILRSPLVNSELRILGESTQITADDWPELEKIADTLGVTINCFSSVLPEIITSQEYKSSLERPNIIRRLLARLVPYSYERERKKTEKRMGIQPSDAADDPEIVHGAVTHDIERDFFFGGTGGDYGDTILVLDPERIKDRTTFTLGDSLGYGAKDVVTWNEAPLLKLIRERFVKKGSNSATARFVEAQISGGVRLEDITEIRFMADDKAEFEAILDSIGGRQLFESRAPHIKLIYTGKPPGHIMSNAWWPRHPQLRETAQGVQA